MTYLKNDSLMIAFNNDKYGSFYTTLDRVILKITLVSTFNYSLIPMAANRIYLGPILVYF